ncbi:MAG: PilZ domain-containing protein [Acidobacteria bacterium]|nr:PilZ domain-containing protein [Acidobacteriota bacterium]
MDHTLVDRRRDARVIQGSRAEVRATLRPGCPVQLVDLSAGGALVEAERPLRPGARVLLHIVSPHQAVAVSALILRCAVWAVDPETGARYRGALRFDQPCELSRALATRDGSMVPGHADTGPPVAGKPLPDGETASQSARQGRAK